MDSLRPYDPDCDATFAVESTPIERLISFTLGVVAACGIMWLLSHLLP